ncbi:MAG: ABC transporter permease subunit [Chloroflexi bacterium]|nr:MAG: ABC transporter permease subunit [Chloroflexota bacterium]
MLPEYSNAVCGRPCKPGKRDRRENMADMYRKRATKTSVGVGDFAEPAPRLWERLLNYLFYIVAALAIGGFIYYLYSFNKLLLIFAPIYLQGTLITLIVSLLSVVLAVILGLVGAFGRLSRFAIFRWLAIAYVEFIRGTPAYVQILFWFNGVGYIFASIG